MEDIVEGFSRAFGKLGRGHLIVVGDGEYRVALEERVRELDLPVSFCGFINQGDIPGYYQAADCLVLASDHGETWGLVVNEAMASGLPAIVSDQVGCAEDLVTSGQTGDVYPFGQTEMLAGKMLAMASDPENAQKMGQNARDFIVQKYNVNIKKLFLTNVQLCFF